jgi:hypothetical protein
VRIPCCTLLIRLFPGKFASRIGPDSSFDNTVDHPIAETSYKDGFYESTLCRPSDAEIQLYKAILQNTTPKTIREAMKQIVKMPDASDEALLFWIDKKLKKEPNVECVNLSFIAPYNDMWGFKVAVDSADGLKNKVCCFFLRLLEYEIEF